MPPHHRAARFAASAALATAATGVALALTLTVEPHISLTVSAPFIAAVVVSTWLGGLPAGLLATLLSFLAVDYYFLPPLYEIGVGTVAEALRALVYLSVALLTSALQSARAGRFRAEQRRGDAEREQAWSHAILDLLPVPLVFLEPGTARVRFANKAAHRMASGNFVDRATINQDDAKGYGSDRSGQPIADTNLPAVRAARGERLENEELTWHAPDGQLTMLISAQTLPAAHAHPATVVMALQDVTRLKETERELASLAERMRLILDAAAEGIYGLDASGITTFINPAAAELLGYRPEDLIGRDMHSVLHHTRADGTPYPREECPIYAAIRDGEVHRVTDEVFWRRDGTNFPVEYISSPKVADGRRTGAVVVFRDVTEQRQAEAELRAAETRYRALVERLPVVTYVGPVDAPEISLFISPQLEKLLGFTGITEQERPTLWARQLHPEDRERVLSEAAGLEEHGVLSLDYRMLASDGRVVWFHDEAAVIRDGGRRLMQGVMLDITAQKQMETEQEELLAREQAALAQAQDAIRARDDFLAMAAHDLKNPLTAIRGQAQLLKRRLRRGGTPTADELTALNAGLESIETTAVRMATLLNEMLDVARLRMGHTLKLEVQPVDLIDLVQYTVEVQQRATERHRLRVEAAVPELIGQWDRARLERVLDNLLSNAVKYTPGGGEITVTVGLEETPAGGIALVQVRDHGIGIPAADLPHLFERFRRGSNVTGRIAGSGIGLAGAWKIVQQHGGVLEVESQEGDGSVFTIRLPLAPPEEEASDEPAA